MVKIQQVTSLLLPPWQGRNLESQDFEYTQFKDGARYLKENRKGEDGMDLPPSSAVPLETQFHICEGGR